MASRISGRLRIETRSSSSSRSTACRVSIGTLSGMNSSSILRFASARRVSVSEVNSSSSLRRERRVKSRPKFALTISRRCVATTSVGVTTERPISAASSCRPGAIQRAGAP